LLKHPVVQVSDDELQKDAEEVVDRKSNQSLFDWFFAAPVTSEISAKCKDDNKRGAKAGRMDDWVLRRQDIWHLEFFDNH